MLLVIELKKSVVVVLDPKRKKQEEFQDVIDLMNKAWARFITENRGPFKEKLHIRTNFPVRTQFAHLLNLVGQFHNPHIPPWTRTTNHRIFNGTNWHFTHNFTKYCYTAVIIWSANKLFRGFLLRL